MIAAIWILIFLESGVQAIWGADFQRMQTPFTGFLNFAGLVIPVQRLLIVIAAFGLVVALHSMNESNHEEQAMKKIDGEKFKRLATAALYGKNVMTGMEMATNEINAKGFEVGGKKYKVEIVALAALPQAQSGQGPDFGNFAELLPLAGTVSDPVAIRAQIDKAFKALPAENNPNNLDGVNDAGGSLANTFVAFVEGRKVKPLNLRGLSAAK